MKKIFFFIAVAVLTSNLVWAKAPGPRYKNGLQKAREAEDYEAVISRIPIYRERLKDHYTIIGPVYAQDALSSKKSSMIYSIRSRAYQLGANAIMEFRCERGWKSIYQQCEGVAVNATQFPE